MNDVLDVVKEYQKAIHTQKKEDFYALWAKRDDCCLISVAQVFHGVESIYQDFLIDRIQKKYLDIELLTQNITVHHIHETMAIVIFEYQTKCLLRETQEAYGIQGIETQVMIKENQQWKLLHVHYSKA